MQIDLVPLSLSRATLAPFQRLLQFRSRSIFPCNPFSLPFSRTLSLSYKLERLSRDLRLEKIRDPTLSCGRRIREKREKTWDAVDKEDDHSKSLDFRMLGSRTHHLSDSNDSVLLSDCHSNFLSPFSYNCIFLFERSLPEIFIVHAECVNKFFRKFGIYIHLKTWEQNIMRDVSHFLLT